MPNLLKVKRIQTVGFVTEGANPEADILIWKSRDEPVTFKEVKGQEAADQEVWDFTSNLGRSLRSILLEGDGEVDDAARLALATQSLEEFDAAVLAAIPAWLSGQAVNKGGPSMTFDINKLSTDAQAEFGKLKEQADKVPGLEEELTKAQEALEAATSTAPSTNEEEDVVKGMTPEVKELFSKLQTEADEAKTATAEVVEKLALGELETFAKAELSDLNGEAPEQARMLRLMETALEEEDFGKVKEMLKGASEAVKQAAILTEEIGSSTTEAPGGDTLAKVKAKAAELVEKGTFKTVQEATAHIWKTDRELAREYEQERSAQA